jgi:hypothetical protein
MSAPAEINSQSAHSAKQVCEQTVHDVGDENEPQGKDSGHSESAEKGLDSASRLDQAEDISRGTVDGVGHIREVLDSTFGNVPVDRASTSVGGTCPGRSGGSCPHEGAQGSEDKAVEHDGSTSNAQAVTGEITEVSSSVVDTKTIAFGKKDTDSNVDLAGELAGGSSQDVSSPKYDESTEELPISQGNTVIKVSLIETDYDSQTEHSRSSHETAECKAGSGEGIAATATKRAGHVSTERTFSNPESTNCEEAGTANKGYESDVASPIEPERLAYRQGNHGLCLPKRPDALELNLASCAVKECQENHQLPRPGRGCGYGGPNVQLSFANTCEYKLNSLEKNSTGIGLVSRDQTLKYSTPSKSIGNYSGLDKKADREQLKRISDGFKLDLKENRIDIYPNFPETVREHSASCGSEGDHAEPGSSHNLDTYTFEKQHEFCLIGRGQNVEYPEETEGDLYTKLCSNTPAQDTKGVLDSNVAAKSTNNSSAKLQHNRLSGTKSGFKPFDTSRNDKHDIDNDLCGAIESPVRHRKLSSAGICKQYFYRRNTEGIPRSRSLSPLTLRQPRDIFTTKLHRDKIRLNAVSDDLDLGGSRVPERFHAV